MRPAALLLDLDGTLVDTEPVHRAAYRRFFEGRGWELPDLSMFTGRRAEDVFATEPGPWTGEDLPALVLEILSHIDSGAVPDPVPGAEALLTAARRFEIPLAIVTSAGPAWVHRLAAGPLRALADVEVVVTAEDVTDGKPDPAGYDLACRRLDVAPAAAWAVEDSPAGVRAAVAAGVGEVVGVTTTHDEALLSAAGASRVVRDLRETAEDLG